MMRKSVVPAADRCGSQGEYKKACSFEGGVRCKEVKEKSQAKQAEGCPAATDSRKNPVSKCGRSAGEETTYGGE